MVPLARAHVGLARHGALMRNLQRVLGRKLITSLVMPARYAGRTADRMLAGKACQIGTQNKAMRDAWLQQALGKLPHGSRILDVGAGELQYRSLCSHLNYVSQDFGRYEGQGNGRGLQKEKWNTSEIDIISDIVSIPEDDASFDAIMCIEVFEHVPEPAEAIKEFHRLLRPGGDLILTAPYCSLTHFAPYHFYSGYNRYFFEFHLERAGFEILETVPNGDYFAYMAQEIRRLSSVADRYSSDRPSKLERYAIRSILRMLQRFSVKDTGSDELLCFGYHVLAKRH